MPVDNLIANFQGSFVRPWGENGANLFDTNQLLAEKRTAPF